MQGLENLMQPAIQNRKIQQSSFRITSLLVAGVSVEEEK
jgi:hypothetical protein